MTAFHRLLVATLLVWALPRVASAQVFRTLEVSAGYSWMNDTTDDERLAAGWSAGAAAGLTKWLSLAADVGGQYKTVPVLGGDIKLRTYGVLFGVRASTRVGPFVEFAQLLGGLSHATGTAFGTTDTITHVGWQPGAGLDLPLGRHVRARGQIDRRWVAAVREIRITGGFVWEWQRQ